MFLCDGIFLKLNQTLQKVDVCHHPLCTLPGHIWYSLKNTNTFCHLVGGKKRHISMSCRVWGLGCVQEKFLTNPPSLPHQLISPFFMTT